MGACCAKDADGPLDDDARRSGNRRAARPTKKDHKLNKYATTTADRTEVDEARNRSASPMRTGVPPAEGNGREGSPEKSRKPIGVTHVVEPPAAAIQAPDQRMFDPLQLPVTNHQQHEASEHDERAEQLRDKLEKEETQQRKASQQGNTASHQGNGDVEPRVPTYLDVAAAAIRSPVPALEPSNVEQISASVRSDEAGASASTPALLAKTSVPDAMPPPPVLTPRDHETTAAVSAAAPAPNVKTANVLASLLPAEDADRVRREREEMLNANEVKRPTMIEFDINFEDDDLIAVEHMGDDAELVEDFVVDDEDDEDGQLERSNEVPSVPGESVVSRNPGADALGNGPPTVFDGVGAVRASVNTPTTTTSASSVVLNKKWFTDRGVVPPRSIQWKQDKRTVTLYISPADASSGWEISADGLLLDFTTTAGGRGNTKIVLPLLHPLADVAFSLDSERSVLQVSGSKVPTSTLRLRSDDDDDEEADDSPPYWTQLIRGTRKEYTALTFISRLLDDDDEDDDNDAYEYGKPGAVPAAMDDDAFSSPEDD